MSELRIPETLVSALEREAGRRGVEAEAVLLELLDRILSERERIVARLETARGLLDSAHGLAREDPHRALGKAWTAMVLCLSAYAVARGLEEPRNIQGYWMVAEKLSEEAEEAIDGWYAGIAALIAREEKVESRRHAELIVSRIKRLYEKTKELVERE